MLRVPVGTVISDADTGECRRRSRPTHERARCSRRAARAASATCTSSRARTARRASSRRGEPGEQRKLKLELQSARRRRAARHAERRQVDAYPRGLGSAARRSPTIRSRRCIRISASCASTNDRSFVDRRHPGPDRRRGRRRGPRPSVPAPPAAHAAAAAPRRHRAVRPGRGSGARCAGDRRRAARSTTRRCIASRAGWCSTSSTCSAGRRERRARAQAFVRRLRWKGQVFVISALTGEGCRELVYAVMDHLERSRATPKTRPPRPRSPTNRDADAPSRDAAATRRNCARLGMRSVVKARSASSSRSARASSPTKGAASTTRRSRAGPRRSPQLTRAGQRGRPGVERRDRRRHAAPRLDTRPHAMHELQAAAAVGQMGLVAGLRNVLPRARPAHGAGAAHARRPGRPPALPQRALDAAHAARAGRDPGHQRERHGRDRRDPLRRQRHARRAGHQPDRGRRAGHPHRPARAVRSAIRARIRRATLVDEGARRAIPRSKQWPAAPAARSAAAAC